MKILILGHTYIVPLNREKFRKLSRLDPKIEVIIGVPQYWQPGGVLNQTIKSEFYQDGNFRVVPLWNWSQNNQSLLVFGWDLVNLLKDFQPHIIQVEQGVKSLAYSQVITLNYWLKLNAKNLFFTWWNLPYQLKFPLSLIESYNLRYTNGLVAGNQDAVDILREHGYQNAAAVLPQLGVDETLFYPQTQTLLAQSLGIRDTNFIFGYVGRFAPEKGLKTLIQALALLENRDWKFLLVGRGQLKAELQTLAQTLQIDQHLLWVENIPHDRVADYLNLMQVLILPSETSTSFRTLTSQGWKEQFGHVLIEAMACRVPVIGSDCGEIPRVIGDAGLVFPEGDVMALKSCLNQLQVSTPLREEFAEKGYNRVQQCYTNRALAQSLLAFYDSLL